MLLEELKDFSNQTSIHGIGQIANDRAPVIKKIIWLAIFVGSLAYAGQQLAAAIKGKPIKNFLITNFEFMIDRFNMDFQSWNFQSRF